MKIAHLSDCHIGQSVQNSQHLYAVVNSINAYDPDIVIATGDITHNGLLSEYLEFLHITASLPQLYAIAGNHDNPTNMQKVFQTKQLSSFSYQQYHIQLIPSQVANQISGYIDTTMIKPYPNSIIFTHHPIVPMLSSWDDSLSITNINEVIHVLNQHILMVGFGHAHQAKDFMHNTTYIYSSPAVASGFECKKEWGYNVYECSDTTIYKQTILMQQE